ncbi:MAG TPA: GNAT family N-acetyltransferase, partial [Blastocatellia bacterium]|nr:GNAT family N-acetyltransferase [Blastocatellia bacterium]
LEPCGVFGAFDCDLLIGTTTALTYGGELAWLGMVFVRPEYRREGVGNRLMNAALSYLDEAGVASIKLDATPEGRPLYESLGFVPEALIERWEGTANISSRHRRSGSNGCWGEEIYSLDLAAFGANRTLVIETLLRDSCVEPLVVAKSDGKPSGFALARAGARASYIGPLIATDTSAALELLANMLDALAGGPVYIDFNTEFDIASSELAARGLTRQRDLLQMRCGPASNAGTSRLVFAIAGPELG